MGGGHRGFRGAASGASSAIPGPSDCAPEKHRGSNDIKAENVGTGIRTLQHIGTIGTAPVLSPVARLYAHLTAVDRNATEVNGN